MKDVKEFADELSDAYSTYAYGNWTSCIRMLRKRGYNDRQIEAIIRSKWTRWALDMASTEKGSAPRLARFLDTMEDLQKQVEELTRETFA